MPTPATMISVFASILATNAHINNAPTADITHRVFEVCRASFSNKSCRSSVFEEKKEGLGQKHLIVEPYRLSKE
ncbi:hypothetical protein [Arcanobacterium phocae]|uniref:hypothetical protein n=1 Tax=Arcanobacterium phocae TaxID=131112 RepID=UPI00209C73B2|nr:hypothetical protein [Arcanobacterium phocae]